ncbi:MULTISPECIES: hypothetical protein [unclassified Paraburkholderia]|uniref:hypothetical protein n=1 Tax=unclassified Paraburkholderia TaxID=2615204 RepID=UPI00160B6BD8|nr:MULTISPECIES: hypothetical protein [unclassified Paraburkholderia]MBB5445452.1 hypothetical protein [Paraburkholderia sp. WSM4177]MBB5486068.1 hypothetical protein [Paraburkholderia sp. WSM4180]
MIITDHQIVGLNTLTDSRSLFASEPCDIPSAHAGKHKDEDCCWVTRNEAVASTKSTCSETATDRVRVLRRLTLPAHGLRAGPCHGDHTEGVASIHPGLVQATGAGCQREYVWPRGETYVQASVGADHPLVQTDGSALSEAAFK